ncbi:patatin-like phospholipase family protein [Subsaximicrobium wynnwilliamsii]|uniref:Patatin-like phospholipase family protein n=1 Tax=Subsaximicrobium wynnwilliamsii TaxID=291179 RepID=A0A5C6ZEI8_9FLAO|nr:patatin-like phospholipase family protein [Subsaximicrobium wynnwilliamsii]TXD82340.1 patatin-like phospholipase family protein [Subsaximicrobium wynnwilliamsii]TXD87978.1 patatin-like phospholipase family protein [Subsaximicrobium wynnwilliamsii]TXE01971.1 patatin-like phospholipase family protein [Subsaximicrobium wynnwilliamsii]
MRALVISGGGSKGAFAGGVAQYLMEKKGHKYDLFIGTSTGSLLVSHLALQKVEKIKRVYTNVNQNSIFNVCPFYIKRKKGVETIGINHFNVLLNLLRGSKTFGESYNLKALIKDTITIAEFETLKQMDVDIVVTVSNLSLNEVEYKSINDFDYEDFCEWVWISCNYTPFMSLVTKNGCEYADGGLGSMVPIEEAIKRGATVVDAIILQTEVTQFNRMPSLNAFSLMTNMFAFMVDRIENSNIRIGKFVATNNDAIINFYYTPTVLTTNSLVFRKDKMTQWWERGVNYAKLKDQESSQINTNLE